MFLIYIQDTSFVLNKCNKPKGNIRMSEPSENINKENNALYASLVSNVQNTVAMHITLA
jgi:hypothetical protein